MTALALPVIQAPSAHAATAAPGPGYVDNSYNTTSGLDEVTSYHSQNKLWFNAGTWWAVMWRPIDATNGKWTINKLINQNSTIQSWQDTGVEVDTRDKSRYDVFSDGNTVYIAASNSNSATNEVKTFVYTYNSGTQKYDAVGSGSLPAALGVQFASITKAGSTLWIGYALDNKVWTASSTNGTSWTTPTALTLSGSTHSPIIGTAGVTQQKDDIAVVAPIPGGVGVMWSRTSDTASDFGGFFFASKTGASAWTAETVVWAAISLGDNHVSLKAAADGRLIAVVKTSLDHRGDLLDPLIGVLARSTTGEWTVPTTHTALTGSTGVGTPTAGRNVSTVWQDVTRPMVVMDEGGQQAQVYFTSVVNGGDIYRRVAPLGSLNFTDPGSGAAKPGEKVIDSSANPAINNATSTKQGVSSLPGGSGIVVLASDKNTKNYLHSCIGGTCPTVEQVASFAAAPPTGTAPLAVTFTNTSTGTNPTWAFGDGTPDVQAATATHNYTSFGSYTATMTAQYGSVGQRQTSQSITVAGAITSTALSTSPNPSTVGGAVSMTATVSSGGGVPTGGVTFKEGTATIAGPIPVTAGQATTSTSSLAQGTHSLTAVYTPNSTAFQGSTSAAASQVVSPVGTTPPACNGCPVAAFTTDGITGRAPMTVQFTDTSTGSPASWAWEFGDGTTSAETSPSHTYVGSGTYQAKLTVTNANGSTATTTAIIVSPIGNRFMPVMPTRVLTGKRLGPNSFTTITLHAPPGSNAVALNVTATKVTDKTMIAVCANDDLAADCVTHGAVRAYKTGRSIGFTIASLDANNAIKIYNTRGTATVNLDVQGWYVGRPKQTTYYTGLAPARRLVTAKAVGHKMYTLAIPASLRPKGTVAVGLNLTAGHPTSSSAVAVCGFGMSRARCAASPDLYIGGSQTVTNHVIARLRPGGTVKLLNTTGTTRLTVDVEGSYSTVDAAALYRPNPQRRLISDRAMAAGSTYTFIQRALPPGTTAVVLRVTVGGATTNGSLSVCQGGTKKKVCKQTSVLAVQRHRTTTNLVIVQVGTGGTIKFVNGSGKNKLTVDVVGSFGRN